MSRDSNLYNRNINSVHMAPVSQMKPRRKALWGIVVFNLCGLPWTLSKPLGEKASLARAEGATLQGDVANSVAAVGARHSPTAPTCEAFAGGTTVPEIRLRVWHQLENLMGSPVAPDLDAARFRKAFEAYVHPTLARPLADMSAAQEAGKTLPGSCDPFGGQKCAILTALKETGTVPFASGPIEEESLLGMYSLLMSQALAGGRAIPDILDGLASQLPPTRASFLVCMAAREALEGVIRIRGPLKSEELAAWQRLATARHPVYRGLALLGAPRVCANQDQLTSIYALFRHESDPVLFGRAVERLGQIASSGARSELQAIKADVLKSGRADALPLLDSVLAQQAEAVQREDARQNK